MLFISKDGIPKHDAFLCDILNSINKSDLTPFLQSIGKTNNDFNQLISSVRENYPLMVIKVPLWYGSVWSLTEQKKFSYDLPLLNDIRIIPYIKDKSQPNLYNTYKVEKNALINDALSTKNVNFDFVPLLVRNSEYHKIIDIRNLEDDKGNSISDELPFVDLDKDSPCYTIDVLTENIEGATCFNNTKYSIVNWIKYLNGIKPCTSPTIFEDCYNKIDDDGDGLVDCDDPDCPCTEICDNNIDDDGDDLVDEDDPDCCWFFASCDRDCVAETNWYEAVRFDNIAVGMFHNIEPAFEDNIGIELIAYEFVGLNTGVPKRIQHYAPFMKLCGLVNQPSATTGTLNPDFDAFYSAQWETTHVPNAHLGFSISTSSPNMTFYLNLSEPLVVGVNKKWHDNWDGTTLGNKVRVETFYLGSESGTTIQGAQYTTQSATQTGASFGLNNGNSGGNPVNGANVGYTWQNTNTITTQTTFQTTFQTTIEPQTAQLSNFDMTYCESNTLHGLIPSCPEGGQIFSVDSVEGTFNSTGSLEIWTSIK